MGSWKRRNLYVYSAYSYRFCSTAYEVRRFEGNRVRLSCLHGVLLHYVSEKPEWSRYAKLHVVHEPRALFFRVEVAGPLGFLVKIRLGSHRKSFVFRGLHLDLHGVPPKLILARSAGSPSSPGLNINNSVLPWLALRSSTCGVRSDQ